MISIESKVGGVSEVVRRFARIKSDAPKSLERELEAIGKDMRNKLASSLRSAVTRRTGRLERSIFARTRKRVDAIELRVGPAKRRGFYGRFIETGVSAQTQVKPHARRARSRDVKGQAEDPKTGRTRRKTVAQGVSFVRGFQRTVVIKARPWAGPTIERSMPEIYRRIQESVSRSARRV